MTRPAGAPVPVTVLTGFLGAGKTTLLNAWLRNPATRGLAVVINEFGTIGIDDALVAEASGDLLSLVTGCVCCAARGDLVDALAALLARRTAAASAFSRIVVETTGLADPGPVLNALLLAPELAGRVRAEGVVTLVSAAEGETVLDRYEEARRQVALADRLVLSRMDLPEGAARAAALRPRLAQLSPAAAMIEASEAARDGHALLAGLAVPRAPVAARPHRHHAADARLRAVVLEAGLVDARHLAAFLDLAAAHCGAALLRLKGLAAVAGDAERPTVIQLVGSVLHPATRLEAWPGGVARTRLVAILDTTDPAAVAALWSDLFGPPAIDRPDAAALAAGTALEPGLF